MILPVIAKDCLLRFFVLLFWGTLFTVSCKTSRSVQLPAAGGEYQVTTQAESQKQDSLLAEEYALKLGVTQQEIKKSLILYKFINRNLDTPCSDRPGESTTTDTEFAQHLYKKVYSRKIPGTYKMLKHSKLIPKFSSRSYLAEGDLLFFENKPKKAKDSITPQRHNSTQKMIGIYLQNNKFVTCSDKVGAVAIDDLGRSYWNRRYKMAGRLR